MGRLSHVAETTTVGDKFGRWTVTGSYYRMEDVAVMKRAIAYLEEN